MYWPPGRLIFAFVKTFELKFKSIIMWHRLVFSLISFVHFLEYLVDLFENCLQHFNLTFWMINPKNYHWLNIYLRTVQYWGHLFRLHCKYNLSATKTFTLQVQLNEAGCSSDTRCLLLPFLFCLFVFDSQCFRSLCFGLFICWF